LLYFHIHCSYVCTCLRSFLSLLAFFVSFSRFHVSFCSTRYPQASSVSTAEQEVQVWSGRKTALCEAIIHCKVSEVDQVVALWPFSSDIKAIFSDYQKSSFAYAKTPPAFINVHS
jgi:hypothetical protein